MVLSNLSVKAMILQPPKSVAVCWHTEGEKYDSNLPYLDIGDSHWT